MPNVKNTSTGPRGAYLKGKLVMAEAGQTIEADDFCEDWFEAEKAEKKPATKAKPPAKDADKGE
ncbi:hypothetical protein INR77_08900 [Erythrobacter sp. SCSIO 43205]|uniref:hypothetical protein n=1 Tax=Erythrobacter sp. SCSIO 43205 TaxID=2779361 RepID=UPI001CA8D5E4|nr:hypothetical protein [Erythrobacter sp. SCSIO 43205]UAB76965.1 hypothetical protein INR77_08900 [Erythrobacter sp. SCSIO 43205]